MWANYVNPINRTVVQDVSVTNWAFLPVPHLHRIQLNLGYLRQSDKSDCGSGCECNQLDFSASATLASYPT